MDLLDACDIFKLSEKEIIFDFDCGDSDLNDFFNTDAINYQNQWLGRTYFFRSKEAKEIVTALKTRQMFYDLMRLNF